MSDPYLTKLRTAGLADKAARWLEDVPADEYTGYPSKWAYAYTEMPVDRLGTVLVALGGFAIAAAICLAQRRPA